jgi:hypothetical protein
MLVTDVCTELTEKIDQASQISMSKVPQISYGNSDSVFDDNFAHPNLFRILPSVSQFNEARLELLKEFKWVEGVGSLYQNTASYTIPHNRQMVSLFQNQIRVLQSQSIGPDMSGVEEELRELKAKGARVILGNFNETWARRVFCQVRLYNCFVPVPVLYKAHLSSIFTRRPTRWECMEKSSIGSWQEPMMQCGGGLMIRSASHMSWRGLSKGQFELTFSPRQV